MHVRFLMGGSLALVVLPGCPSNASPGEAMDASVGDEPGQIGNGLSQESGSPRPQRPTDAGPDSSAPQDLGGRDAFSAEEGAPEIGRAHV